MIRSLPVGRLSNISATMLVAAAMNIVLALACGFGLFALGEESMGLNGSLLYGAALGVTGLLFAAATALFVQLTSNARSASAYSLAFMGIAYLVRAAGDVNNEALARVSPLGLVLRTQAFVNDYWWPIFVMLGLTVVITVIAFYLNAVRDLGEGLIPARPGRKSASSLLQSPMGSA